MLPILYLSIHLLLSCPMNNSLLNILVLKIALLLLNSPLRSLWRSKIRRTFKSLKALTGKTLTRLALSRINKIAVLAGPSPLPELLNLTMPFLKTSNLLLSLNNNWLTALVLLITMVAVVVYPLKLSNISNTMVVFLMKTHITILLKIKNVNSALKLLVLELGVVLSTLLKVMKINWSKLLVPLVLYLLLSRLWVISSFTSLVSTPILTVQALLKLLTTLS